MPAPKMKSDARISGRSARITVVYRARRAGYQRPLDGQPDVVARCGLHQKRGIGGIRPFHDFLLLQDARDSVARIGGQPGKQVADSRGQRLVRPGPKRSRRSRRRPRHGIPPFHLRHTDNLARERPKLDELFIEKRNQEINLVIDGQKTVVRPTATTVQVRGSGCLEDPVDLAIQALQGSIGFFAEWSVPMLRE